MQIETQRVDYLVIGGGVAGLRAAIALAPHGSVQVVTKDMPTESSSEYAQGGVAVALSDEDEVSIHYEDTIRAGDGLCNEHAVRVLVEEGPARIQELIEWGAEFDRDGARLSFTLEAAHSRKRILHAQGDATGHELMRVLLAKARSFPCISRSPFAMVLDLIVRDGRAAGAYVIKDRKVVAVLSKATILATGGGGQIYSVTTNPQVATADGMALAHRAGAQLKDMEFVQFHPTSLYMPATPHFLLTEAMRGEGAILRNINGVRFMPEYNSNAELAPRDVVSRSIMIEMASTGASHVYLDLTHLDANFLRKRFPKIHATCLQYGIDITRDQVPVCPAAHYMMGGVRTDTDGRTDIEGLFAAGEVACTGIHGANRLASNSLLEGIVYGARAGEAAAAYGHGASVYEATRMALPEPIHTLTDHDEIRGALRRLMWDKVGIVRSSKSMHEAMETLEGWDYVLTKTFLSRREIELKNMIQVAGLITSAALSRKQSVGAHYRVD